MWNSNLNTRLDTVLEPQIGILWSRGGKLQDQVLERLGTVPGIWWADAGDVKGLSVE